MKKNLHIRFALMAVLIAFSGFIVKAQNKNEVHKTLIINDGDTVINGEKLKDASLNERMALLKELKEMQKAHGNLLRNAKGEKDQDIVFQRNLKEPKIGTWGSDMDNAGYRFNTDSLTMFFNDDSINNRYAFTVNGLDSNVRKVITMNRSLNGHPDLLNNSHPGMFLERSEMMNRIASRRENTQLFNYVSTDKDGISSRMSIQIAEINSETLKKLSNAKTIKSDLEINDLTFSPNFSNGKLNLFFNLAETGITQVKIVDRGYKEIFSDKLAIGVDKYFKQIALPKNGIYYIVISQREKTFARKVIKE